jgi:glycosyltransferase involved in cell wall biosynthesis
MMKPLLSIIIPCYNSRDTLEETLQSVLYQKYDNWEAILVNDGSPDNLENIALKWIEKDARFKYFKKKNGGLGSARNYGINKAKGKYILPLDSDNRIRPEFAKNAISLLEDHHSVGVVYGNAMYIGDRNDLWLVKEFNFEEILIKNYIDACAIYHKTLWTEIGGYDTKMPYQGNEDWDFWLALGVKKVVFKHLNEITFDYRVTETSMINSFNSEMYEANKNYIRRKYGEHYFIYFQKNYNILENHNKTPLKSATFFLKKWIKSLMR